MSYLRVPGSVWMGLETEHTKAMRSSFKGRVRPSVPLQPLLQKFLLCLVPALAKITLSSQKLRSVSVAEEKISGICWSLPLHS